MHGAEVQLIFVDHIETSDFDCLKAFTFARISKSVLGDVDALARNNLEESERFLGNRGLGLNNRVLGVARGRGRGRDALGDDVRAPVRPLVLFQDARQLPVRIADEPQQERDLFFQDRQLRVDDLRQRVALVVRQRGVQLRALFLVQQVVQVVHDVRETVADLPRQILEVRQPVLQFDRFEHFS